MAKKINSLELPEGTYKLTKKTSTNGHQPFVVEGQSVTGILYTPILKVGDICQVVESFSSQICTSMIKEISISKNTNVVTLITRNSVYELEEV